MKWERWGIYLHLLAWMKYQLTEETTHRSKRRCWIDEGGAPLAELNTTHGGWVKDPTL